MEHIPVLLEECISGLNIKPGGIYVDGTLGRGGHSREIAGKLSSGKLIAIDRDAQALDEAAELLAEFSGRISLIRGDFRNISEILETNNVPEADGMLFDLGVSSPQLDDTERGFSYMHDAPLDMRMDKQSALTAYDVVNLWPGEELQRIFFEYGEERYSRQIARAITKRRGTEPISSTFMLNEAIISAIPSSARREAQHPSKRCFQAIRIAVNDELGAIADMLEAAPDKLKPGGRICIICFHSLESKLVKRAFSSRVNGCKCPKDLPVCVCGFAPTLKMITKKAIKPRAEEVTRNPRARSAELRIAEKV